MLNKIQEKVSSFIESFSVHELLEVPVEKVSVAAIHSLYQLLDAVPVGLYVLCMCPVRCYKALWVIDRAMFKTQVHSVSSGKDQRVIWFSSNERQYNVSVGWRGVMSKMSRIVPWFVVIKGFKSIKRLTGTYYTAYL